MTMTERTKLYHLFDGDGGESGLGAEASAFLESLGGGQKAAESAPKERKEYGLPSGNDQQSHDGGDTEAPDLGAEFAELIGKGGKFHDIYGQHVAEAIQNRFKNQQDYQATLGSYDDALSPLYMKYDLEPGDIEGLGSRIANDLDIFTGPAEEAGIDPAMYMEQLRLRAQALEGQRIKEAYQQQQARNAKYSQWEAEAVQLKEMFPNFDLGMELNNESFARLLDNGLSVQDAFAAAHIGDILNGINAENSRAAQQNVVHNIQQRAARPAENGLRNNAAIVRKTDPSALTDAEMDEIITRAMNGEKFRF